MIKDISKIMMWHVWKVTYLCRHVTIVCGASYHLLGSLISRDSKIRFRLQVESCISNWQFSKLQHLARYVSRHNAMAYDTRPHEWSCQTWKSCRKKNLIRKKINCHDPGGHEKCKDSITIKKAQDFVRVGEELLELMVSRKYFASFIEYHL